LSEQVRVLGKRRDIGQILAGAHLGVLTSRYEALPVALLEYMAAGLPAVVTDVGDCGHAVRASGGGVAVLPGDVSGFAAAIARLAESPSDLERWGAANREYVARHHGVEAMVGRVAEVYRRLLAGEPVPPPAEPGHRG
jgi:glycosyltransferase involved in cell wall biosynthesis